MRLRKIEGRNSGWGGLAKFAAAAVVLACIPAGVFSQEKGQKTFPSAEDATQAFVKAAQDNDQTALVEIVGKSAKDIISSGDQKDDAERRSDFVKRYEQMHRLVKEPDGTTTLYVGAYNWPLPISLVNKGNVWYFDGVDAKQEILYRRVGRNEVSTIRVLEQLAAAQNEYFAADHVYASKIASDPGEKNGLYWGGDSKCPMGPLVAAADATNNASPTPFRGYYFRVLTEQGKDAPGGAKKYVVDGKMTGGFAVVAYPVEYRSSGVMTFVVGPDGVVHEKDLGKKTETEAKMLKSFNPDSSWHRAEEQQEATSAQTTK